MIKVTDIAYVRFGAPDLDIMEQFVTDFGFEVSCRTEDALYVRGTDPSPYLHVTERGEASFTGLAFEAATVDDLRSAAELPGGSPVEKIASPGGGVRVRFEDPDGFRIEVVHGRELLPPLTVRSAAPLNRGSDRRRRGTPQRPQPGPACVKRIGHAGLFVSDFLRSRAWYQSRFGFVSTDEVYLGAPDQLVAAFMRCDRGELHTDHHTLVCASPPGVEVGLDHVAFEVEDFDAVMLGHEHLKSACHDHKMGVGRHILGSQVYDYWRDPWGNVHEHFTDGDLLNDAYTMQLHDPSVALGSQWGSLAP